MQKDFKNDRKTIEDEVCVERPSTDKKINEFYATV